jgi:glutamate-1-semialdehyde 2,1-aminomutase
MDYSKRLHSVIPGGAHTYSRGDDQFPSNAPPILSHGRGSHIWSPEGKEFIDYGMGLRSVNIGYGNEEIANAAYQEILKGNNLTRASTTELYAAELLSNLIPSAEMVKFAKHGSTVTTAALKLARAYTNRSIIAIPFEQPFFSFDDWFIGSTIMNRGVPEGYRQLTKKFNYNDIDSLNRLFEEFPNQIAAVMLEAATSVPPKESDRNTSQNFLHQVKELCSKNDSLFILDEMITGFRWDLLGAQHYYNIEPDLATFGKAMANGFAVAALTGKREIMKIGALGAFIKTVEILKRDNVIEHFWIFGKRLMKEMNLIAKEFGIQNYFEVKGFACSPNYITCDRSGENSLAFRTLFAQEMIANGVLMPYIAFSFSHSESDLDKTLEAVRKSLKIYSMALAEPTLDNYLHSDPIKPVFRKFN